MRLASGIDLIRVPSDPNELILTITKYKTITSILERHLRTRENVFCQLIDIFIDYFDKSYSKILAKAKSNGVKTVKLLAGVDDAILNMQ